MSKEKNVGLGLNETAALIRTDLSSGNDSFEVDDNEAGRLIG